ncbi:zonular occludens toxin domain-containing protein [Zoogloea sp.]|uniref:zonular occludens toxin domain-containing protein n=1 Tax=Zoogloea sp. TaxID=49181 RepID=UPI0035B2CD59
MADYLVTGKKGNGKTLVTVARIREALRRGAPVATNLDLNLDKILPLGNRSARVIRLPDKPTRADLDAIGSAYEGKYDEARFGCLVLDELATWLNSRTFQDKDRQGVLEWLAHSRKLHWDTYLIAQHPNQIDKQVREAMAEFHVVCRRADRIKIPFLPFRPPRLHIAYVRYGVEQHALLSDRWIYRGNGLFAAYNTEQVFRSDYPHGIHSVLPPGYWAPARPATFMAALAAYLQRKKASRPALKPKLPAIACLAGLPADQAFAEARRLIISGAV